MKMLSKVICAIIIICLLASCTAEPKNNVETDNNSTTNEERNSPETSVSPEPMGNNANEKISHSYGVAKTERQMIYQ